MGKPYRESHWEWRRLGVGVSYVRRARRHAGPRRRAGDRRTNAPDAEGAAGHGGGIVPFNFPVLLFGWQAAAALAAANAVIVKPSELTPLTMLMAMQGLRAPARRAGADCSPAGGDRARSSSMPTRTPSPSPATCRRRNRRPGRSAALQTDADRGPRATTVHRHAVGAGRRRRSRGAAFAAFLSCGQVCTSAEALLRPRRRTRGSSRRSRSSAGAAPGQRPGGDRPRADGLGARARTRRGRRRARGRAGRASSAAGGGHPHSGAAGSTSRPCLGGPARDGDHARRVLRPAGAGVPASPAWTRRSRAPTTPRWAWGQHLHPGDLAEAMRARCEIDPASSGSTRR